MERENKNIKTVLSNDIDKILDKAKIKDLFYSKEIKCKFCGDTVTVDNIYSFLPESGALNLVCCKEKCISGLLDYIDKKTKTKIDF